MSLEPKWTFNGGLSLGENSENTAMSSKQMNTHVVVFLFSSILRHGLTRITYSVTGDLQDGEITLVASWVAVGSVYGVAAAP